MEAAGKFECYALPSFAAHERRILYVGKASSGEFEEEQASKHWFNKSNSRFWTFARQISTLADPGCSDLSNLAWSNIFKHGVARGNPYGQFAEAQRKEATCELKKEVKRLKPTLIVLVNADYYEEIPKTAYAIIDGEDGAQALTRTTVPGEQKYDLWSRASYEIFPPIVWMWHPQVKRREYTDAALTLIKQVAGW